MLIRTGIGEYFDISPTEFRTLRTAASQEEAGWISQRIAEVYTPLTEDELDDWNTDEATDAEPADLENIFDGMIVTRSLASHKPRKTSSLNPRETFTASVPIIAETNSDGTKRLYKTRYNELEHLYLRLLSAYQAANKDRISITESHYTLTEQNRKQVRELHHLKAQLADSAALDKRISVLCKTAGLSLGLHPLEIGTTLEGKLDAFFGAILCKLRQEEVVDELAD